MSNSTVSPSLVGDLQLLNTTIGLLLNGYILSMTLYGFVAFQAYIYYSKYPHDSRALKVAVTILIYKTSGLDTSSVVLLSHALHFYLIVQFSITFYGIETATITYCADFGMAVIIIFITQLGYAHRISTLTNKKHLSWFIAIVATTALAFGLAVMIRLLLNPAFSALALSPFKALMACSQIFTFLTAVIIFAVLCLNDKPRSETKRLSKIESTLEDWLTLFVDRGGAAVLIQLGYLITFLAFPSKQYWIIFQLISRKLFAVSFLTMLDSRAVVRGRGVYADDSDSLRARSANLPVSSSRQISSIKFTHSTGVAATGGACGQENTISSFAEIGSLSATIEDVPSKHTFNNNYNKHEGSSAQC